MSGIAIAASTMPGSVATFCSCSSERSARIAERISSSANTRAGTRMSSRVSAGSSYSVLSIRRGSDVEDDPRVPDVAVSFEPKPVMVAAFTIGSIRVRLPSSTPERRPPSTHNSLRSGTNPSVSAIS
jgi:hypothetical protein